MHGARYFSTLDAAQRLVSGRYPCQLIVLTLPRLLSLLEDACLTTSHLGLTQDRKYFIVL
jgi:hypothetical protein